MSWPYALLVLIAVLVAATIVGFVLRASASRPKRTRRAIGELSAVLGDAELGAQATFVQFSTEICAQCPQVRRTLAALAEERNGVRVIEVDLTHDTATASRLRIMQTPTVFVLDSGGEVHARFGGATARAAFERELDRVVDPSHV